MLNVVLALCFGDISGSYTQIAVFTNGDCNERLQAWVGEEIIPTDIIRRLLQLGVARILVGRPGGGQRGLAVCIWGSWCTPKARLSPKRGTGRGSGADAERKNADMRLFASDSVGGG